MKMLSTPDLFNELPATACVGYRNLREPPSANSQLCRTYCEYLWGRFRPYADKDFVQDFAVHLHQRFWEMYLAVTLLEAGHTITAPKPGPDFGIIHGGRRIWIEAVTATAGEPGRPDSIPVYELKEGEIEAGRVPQDQIVLRCTAAISAKFPKQYRQHAASGIIGPDDCYIVAVNHAEAYQWAEVGTPPFILRAVLGVGPLFVTIDKKTLEIVSQGAHYRGSIPKSSGASVDTALFLSSESDPLSAVIGSVTTIGTPVHLQQEEHAMGQDFLLVRNPMARNRIPPDLLVRGQQFDVSFSDNEYQVAGRPLG